MHRKHSDVISHEHSHMTLSLALSSGTQLTENRGFRRRKTPRAALQLLGGRLQPLFLCSLLLFLLFLMCARFKTDTGVKTTIIAKIGVRSMTSPCLY